MHTDLNDRITKNKSDIDKHIEEFKNIKQEESKEKQELVNEIKKNDGKIKELEKESTANKQEIEKACNLIKYTSVIPILNEFGDNIISKIPKKAQGKLDVFIDTVMRNAESEIENELKKVLRIIKLKDEDTNIN